MARFAVVDNGVVVGVMSAPTIPVLNIPPYRQFVDITDGPDVRGGEIYSSDIGAFFVFNPRLETELQERISALEIKTVDLEKAVDEITKTGTVDPMPIEPAPK